MSINMEQVQLLGITNADIQEIFERSIKESNVLNPGIMFLDVSYLYTFHLDEFVEVKKFNLLGRYYAQKLKKLDNMLRRKQKVDPQSLVLARNDNSRYCLEWHRSLERWLDDRNVILGGKIIRPIKISRSLDRVVNEGLEMLAGCITGGGTATFENRSIGDGTGGVSPADTILSNEINRINVNDTPEGGSMSKDGTTIYSVGNHSKDIETPNNGHFTECGIESTDDPDTDEMLDHSEFEDPVPHIQFADAPGSSTIIYMCAS